MTEHRGILLDSGGRAAVSLPNGDRYILPEANEVSLTELAKQGINQFHATAQATTCGGFFIWIMWRSRRLTASKRLELRVSCNNSILPAFLEEDGNGGWRIRENGPLWNFTGYSERDDPVSN